MTTTEAPDVGLEYPEDIDAAEWKALPAAASTSPLTGVIDHDDEDGTITALVAVSGVPDEVGDVIVPGSLGKAIKRLKPKGVDNHNWGVKVSKLVYSTELMPGDSRLPAVTADGSPWPANAGGLLVKAKYNLDKQVGRDAYADAKFYGPEESFSIGYKVRPGGSRMRGGLRHLSDYDIYEYSQVLHGAHRLAHLTGVKSLHTAVEDPATWYDDPRSGLTTVEGTEFKVRTVRNAKFRGEPVGTPIKPGTKPRGVTPSRHVADGAPGGGAPSAAGSDPVATAVAHLEERVSELRGSSSVAAIGVGNTLAQFIRPGADVHASPDAQIAAVSTGKGWVMVDTANASPLSMLPASTPPDQVDDALAQIAALPIPWDDIDARLKRWSDPATKLGDKNSVLAIIARHTRGANLGAVLGATPAPKGADTAQARSDAEGAISAGDRDGLAEALPRMGLPADQDPHDTAAGMLVLPTEVAHQRLDKIQAGAGAGRKPPGAPRRNMMGQVPAQHAVDAQERIASGYPHPGDEDVVAAHAAENPGKIPAPGPTDAPSFDDTLGITEGADGEIEVDEATGARQDRVAALLDAGDAGLTERGDAQLGTDRGDLAAELRLQTELATRPAGSKVERATPAPAGQAGPKGAPAAPAEDAGPKLRGGVAGAAEDLADALEAKDAGRARAAAERLSSSLRRSKVTGAGIDGLRSLINEPPASGDIHNAITRRILTPDVLRKAAGMHRGDAKARNAVTAGKRRLAKRLDRDRIRSLLGSVDTELRRRKIDPDKFGGKVPAEPGAAVAEPDVPKAPGKAKADAPSKPEPKPDTTARDAAMARDAHAAKGTELQSEITRAYERGDHAQALRTLGEAEREHPERAATWAKMRTRLAEAVKAKEDAGKPEPKPDVPIVDRHEARKNERDAQRDAPTGGRIAAAQQHMRDARDAADDGDFEGAHAHLDEAEKLNPERQRLWDKARGVITEQQDHAQSASTVGGDHGSVGDDDGTLVPDVPAAGVRGDHRQAEVLPGSGDAGATGDRPSDGRRGGGGPAGRDVREEARPADRGAGTGDRTGDEGDVVEPPAPGLAGQPVPPAVDAGPERPAATPEPGRPATDAGDGRLPGRGGPTGERTTGEQPPGDADAPAAPEPELAQPYASPAAVDAIPDTGDSFHPTGADDFAPAGKKAKLTANIAALHVLARLQGQHRSATPDEQAILARWSGWGGIPEVFDDSKPEFATEREELRRLLSPNEWNEARRNTLNAHYTSANVVQALWSAVEGLGFNGGRVLEPGSGSGTFIGFAPQNVDMVGVELDSTTAAISRALYPHATIRNESFADTRVPAGSFDAVIGNVPFGQFALTDKVHNPGGHSIHNHFILKSLELAKPGGIVAVLTSRYTLDSQNDKARKLMAEKADLIGAVRLPTGSHMRTAGTGVIEDVLIFRRREPGAPPAPDQSWVTASKRDIDGQEIPVSDYFTEHPDHVLGEPHAEPGRYGSGELRVIGDKDVAGLPAVLDQIVSSARESGLTSAPRMDNPDVLVDPDTNRHEGHIGVDEAGDFTQAVGGLAVPFPVPAAQREELRGLLGLRDTMLSLLSAESGSVANTPEIRGMRKDLNDQYDAYVARYGPICRYTLTKTGARNTPGQGGFRRDPLSASVRALEVYDAETGTASKTNIFSKRTVGPREIPTTASNPADALALSLDTYGEVNLPAIAGMLGIDADKARAELGPLVYEQPPLSDAEEDAAWAAHVEDSTGLPSFPAARFGGSSGGSSEAADASDLVGAGEAPRAAGTLEPAAAALSGNVRRKLAAARLAAATDPRFNANVAALEKVIPTDLGPTEINARLGAAWVGAPDVQQFLVDILGVDNKYNQVQVASSGGGIWTVEAPKHGNVASEVWGTDRKSVGELMQAMLEQRPIKVTDTIDGKSYPNLEATLAAQAKGAEIQERFSEWLWEDSDRSRRLAKAYNDQFNAIVLRNYDGIDRVFPGMAESFEPRPHQVAAVNRIVAEPTATLGHVVGAGKTAEMAMGAAELKRLGLANKPAIVVPNHMLEQFSREYLQIYPQAKILTAGIDDLKGDRRREFVARSATGDWDCVILTQSAFQGIPMSREAQQAYIDRELTMMRSQLIDAQAAAKSGKANEQTVKKMEAAVVRAEEALKKKLDKDNVPGVSFEQSGIDYLMVDEAHQYSNLRTLSNIQGAAITGADRASDLHMKLEHLRANNTSGRVATFATGTPIRNSITQMYVMQRYMRPDVLEQAGIHSFDQWAATFGEVVEEMELKPEGTGFRLSSRFAKFRNVPELARLFHVFADIKTAEDLKLPVPKLLTGGVQNVTVPASDELSAYMAELGHRADDVRSGAVKPEDDNMLKITGDGRKAALSMRLVGSEHQPGKIEAAADRIHQIYEATKDRPVPCDLNNPIGGACPPPGGLQLVFLDMGTPGGKSGDWNAYQELRDQLAARGMDPATIRFMHEAKNDAQKAELFAAARNGQVSVLIGSTEKMGVGTNVQRRAVALHHLDAPWRPSDVEQRDGRILRQGNSNKDAGVDVIRYVTEGSFDAYMWQTLARKQKFIDQVMRNSLDVREIEDIGDAALSYDEVKALATGNPILMDKAKADTSVAKLSKLERVHARTQTNLVRDIHAYTANAAGDDAEAATLTAAIAKRTDTRGEKFSATFPGSAPTTDRSQASSMLSHAMDTVMEQDRYSYGGSKPVKLATIGGHDVMGTVGYNGRSGRRELALSLDGVPRNIHTLSEADLHHGGSGTIVRIENNLAGFESRRSVAQSRAEHLRGEIGRMKERVGLPFAKTSDLESARADQARLQAALEAHAKATERAATGEPVVDPNAGLVTARQKAAAYLSRLGRSTWNKTVKERLKRFVTPAASGTVYASPDGSLAAMGGGSDFQVFMTEDGIGLRPHDLEGAVDDPAGLLRDLQSLKLPFEDGQAGLERRWHGGERGAGNYRPGNYDKMRAAKEADGAAIRAVWERHIVQEKSLITPFDLLRARRLGAEVKAGDMGNTAVAPDPEDNPDPDEESYAQTVMADRRYVIDARGQLLIVLPCPRCGSDVEIPSHGDAQVGTCDSCGYQMRPTAAAVA